VQYLLTNPQCHGDGIAYVYCDYRDRAKQTAEKIISSLICQLVEKCASDIPQEVIVQYESYTRERKSLSLEDCMSLLLAVSSKFRRTFIIIDALDEYLEPRDWDGQGSRSLVSMLQKLQSYVRLLITSRPQKRIEEVFKRATRIDVVASSSDIKKYLASRIMNSNFAVLVDDLKLRGDVIGKISENSGGVSVLTPSNSGCLTLTR
jgi:hypothetical protein